jgi:RNA polymerase sigma factor (TIGR02999 family)
VAPSATAGDVPPVEVPALSPAAGAGDPARAAALFAALYSELHQLAHRQRAGRRVTLGTTTLLHEAYVAMAGRAGAVFPDRGRFMGYAARVMRGLVIDHVRHRSALKRGGDLEPAPLSEDIAAPGVDAVELARIGEAVERLAAVSADQAQVVDLKFFCGFSFAEIAALRGLSERTIQRHWEQARLYLHRALGAGPA